ncbi:autotransporter-associated beta strand repeat-containing protein, partial [Sphingosinicella sp. CPCC 101087]|uniref:beta strand repeat-containing protein n=1 Tax=Sphingosinicella sp. CPCC 101087 TaxID=2497754 RepID=UPI001980FAA9
MLLALPSVAAAQNANRYWDANSTTPGAGGAGTWDTTSLRWSTDGNGTGGLYDRPWQNARLDNAIFAGTAGTVNLSVPITVHNITFNTANYTLTGNTLTLAGTTPTITVNSGTSTINSVITGTQGLTKAGAGGLTLGGANTFSGGVRVDAGTLFLNAASSFTGNITVNGGTLRAASDAAFGAASNSITTTANATFWVDGGTTNRSVSVAGGTDLTVRGAGGGSARFTGSGNVVAINGVTLTNSTSNYTGTTTFALTGSGQFTAAFTSIGNLNEASSLGAPTTVENGTIAFNAGQFFDVVSYRGDGDSSNRNWSIALANYDAILRNDGTGTLTITGDIEVKNSGRASFSANLADLELLGVISGGAGANVTFGGGAGRTVRLGSSNSFAGSVVIAGATIVAPTLAGAGINSSLGAGSSIALTNGGILSYTGAGASVDRTWTSDGTTAIRNDGSGALDLSGDLSFVAGGTDALTLGGTYAGTNSLMGVLSGSGGLISSGSGTWVLSGVNTRTGTITVDGGTLRAGEGNISAFGTITGVTVNGGTLDLNGNSFAIPSLNGSGGTVALGNGTLTLNVASGTNSFGGALTGTGGLTKTGAGSLTLHGQSSYTGATTIGGGAVTLDFGGAGAPGSNILAANSSLVMGGGILNLAGGVDTANSQSFTALNVTAGSNRINATTSGIGTMVVDLGLISRSGGLVDFAIGAGVTMQADNGDGELGGWATINGQDYAQVQGGILTAFSDYDNKDNAADWVTNDIVSDEGGTADTPFSGTVSGDVQLGGLKYTAAADSDVAIGATNTLGVDGAIIVAPDVGSTSQTIQGGFVTGGSGGGVLGVLQNSAGTFTIASTIVDNGGATGFSAAGIGTGTVALTGDNSYTGATTVAGGATLSIDSVADAGTASAIGAASTASSNLVIEGGTLLYTGGTASTNRGFTLATSGATTVGTVNVELSTTNLTFGGLVTSPDNAGLTKTGGGTLTLSNGGNDYVGVTTIRDGTLSVGTLANGSLASGIGAASSDSSNLVLQGGGELEYTGGTIEIDRGFTLGTGGGAIDVATSGTELTISGTVVGALAGQTLTKNGAGTLILAGINSGFAAGGVVDAGTLRAGSAESFGTGSWTVASGAALDLADRSNGVGALNGSGNVTLGSLATTTLTIGGANSTSAGFSGMISGAGNVTHTNGTQVMTGCGNSYTGVTTITGALGGSVLTTNCILDGGENSGIGASGSDASNLVIQNSGILNYTAVATDQVTDRGFTLAAGFGYIQVADAGTVLEFTGDFTGPGALIKRGAGTLVLSGANGSTGETRVEAGVLRSGSATSFTNGRRLLMSNAAGALFDLNGFDATFSALDGGGALGGDIALGGATLTLLNTENRTYSGTISGSGSLVKTGSENQGLAGCGSSYTGSTTINSGVLFVRCLTDGLTNSSIGASSNDASNLVLNGGALQYTGTGDSTDRQFTLGGSARINASGTGALAFTSTAAVTLAGPGARTLTLGGTNTGDNVFAAQLTDAEGGGVTSLTKAEAGTWRLSNADSTYTGVTSVLGGVLSVDQLADGGLASSIGRSTLDAANLVIGSDSTLRYTGAGDSTNRLFTLQTGVTFIESSGTGAIAFTNTGTMAFQGNGTRIFALGGTNTDVNVMGVSITDGTGGATTVAKNDAGNWYLTGNSTYTGPTNINAGT